MARLTDSDKKAFKALSERGWRQSDEERSPVLVDPTPEVNEAYAKWVSELSRLPHPPKPIRFSGNDWKL